MEVPLGTFSRIQSSGFKRLKTVLNFSHLLRPPSRWNPRTFSVEGVVKQTTIQAMSSTVYWSRPFNLSTCLPSAETSHSLLGALSTVSVRSADDSSNVQTTRNGRTLAIPRPEKRPVKLYGKELLNYVETPFPTR